MSNTEMYRLDINLENMGIEGAAFVNFTLKRNQISNSELLTPEYSKIHVDIVAGENNVVSLVPNDSNTLYECVVYRADRKSIGHFLFKMPFNDCWLSDVEKMTSRNDKEMLTDNYKDIYLGEKIKFAMTFNGLEVSEEFTQITGKIVDENRNFISDVVVIKTTEKDVLILKIDATNWNSNLAGKRLMYNLVFKVSEDGIDFDTIYASPLMYINVHYSPSYVFGG